MITKYFEQINIAYEDIKAGKYNKTVIENSEIIMYNKCRKQRDKTLKNTVEI